MSQRRRRRRSPPRASLASTTASPSTRRWLPATSVHDDDEVKGGNGTIAAGESLDMTLDLEPGDYFVLDNPQFA